MEKQKRKRGANYTAEEKALFANLVMMHENIIADKRTGGLFIRLKKEAWNTITQKYNKNCTSGARDTEQLKALYDNLKQKSRKTVAESNVIHETSGGVWRPNITESDAKILPDIQDQVQPLSNPYDSAASYFNETDNLKPLEDQHCLTTLASTSYYPAIEINEDDTETDQGKHNMDDATHNVLTAAQHRVMQKKQVPKNIKKDISAGLITGHWTYFAEKLQFVKKANHFAQG